MHAPKLLVATGFLLIALAGCLEGDAAPDAADPGAEGDADGTGTNGSDGPRTFEAQEPSGTCGEYDSLEPILPTSVDPTGLATGWELLELDVVMLADPAFQDENPGEWEALLQALVDDANVHYEEQLGIRWNATLIDGLPNGSLEAGTHDGQQRDVARGYMAEYHPDLDWDIVAVILGADYEGSVAGQVECVHGLAYKDYAYLWAEYDEPRGRAGFPGGVGLLADLPLKVFMHEAAHLLAAHHHYTQCGSTMTSYSTDDALAACGTMVNDIGLASTTFSATNKLVMRSFVEELGVGEPVEG